MAEEYLMRMKKYIDMKKYCEENSLQIVAKERCADSYWNYLSNGTEFDYSIE